MIGPLFIFIVLIIISLVISDFNIEPQYCLFLTYFQFVVGFYQVFPNSLYWLYIATLFLVFIISSHFYKKTKKMTTKNSSVSAGVRVSKFNSILYWVIVFFIVYHYAVGGIPALSSNVITDRFDMTSSGLFGIPGRMATYGKFFILLYASYFYFYGERNKTNKKYFYIAIFIYVVTSLFSGTKSAIFGLLDIVIYILAFSPKKFNIRKFLKIKYIGIVVLIFGFGLAYFSYYFRAYQNIFSGMNMWDYVLYRLTNMSVESGEYLVKYPPTERMYYFTDFLYYMQKYFHFEIIRNIYPLELYTSLGINHVLFAGPYNIYTPVTMGFGSEFIYHFGVGSLIITIGVGMLYSKINLKLHRCNSPFKYASYGTAILFMNSFIAKGNLAYSVINYILIMLMIYMIDYFTKRYRLKIH